MLVAHADEVGMMVTFIDDKGFVYFQEIGGVDTNLLPGQRVEIHNHRGVVVGVIGKKPIHLQDREAKTKILVLRICGLTLLPLVIKRLWKWLKSVIILRFRHNQLV